VHYRIMLKKLAILSLLLVVFGTHCDAQKVQPKQSDKQPKTPVAAVSPQQANGTGVQPEQSKDVHADAKIVNPPEKDFYDKAPVWINLILVVVAIGTGIVIGWQSWETRKAAQASNRQLVFQKEALRPRLSISGFLNDTFNEARNGEWVFIKMEISNSGGMPAYGVVADTWIEFIRCEKPYKYSADAKYARTTPFDVHTGTPTMYSVPLHRKLTEDERYQIAKAKGTIFFRMRMVYRSWGDEVYTDQAYIARPGEMESVAEYSSAS
jgi:hypothetical protein